MKPQGTGMRVGPSGNSESFYAQGGKRTADAFAWQQRLYGLDAFEYPFGRGITLTAETARDIGLAANAAGVALSAHAPYFINLASLDGQQAEKSIGYILGSALLLSEMGGSRLVVHIGSPKDGDREDALALSGERLLQARALLKAEGLGHVIICPETMGRPGLIGTLDEILYLVSLDESFLPCLDFAHLHAAGGSLDSSNSFARVLDCVESAIGLARAQGMHVHFSRIEFGLKGEIRQRTFADKEFGPDFKLLAPLFSMRGYHGTLICESRGTMAEDAAEMKRLLEAAAATRSKENIA